ncbi:hypothetical protein PVAP13_5KG550807 [Panicum virgatum]|uniref:Uncharacterized protein n=1 Tax=Panicum virgatum TaxID=38727 RepID=A0A8T0SXD4_PANVG|nr:hypothetical protein PVAP13_5KG550807 [Panicum virgatum]
MAENRVCLVGSRGGINYSSTEYYMIAEPGRVLCSHRSPSVPSAARQQHSIAALFLVLGWTGREGEGGTPGRSQRLWTTRAPRWRSRAALEFPILPNPINQSQIGSNRTNPAGLPLLLPLGRKRRWNRGSAAGSNCLPARSLDAGNRTAKVIIQSKRIWGRKFPTSTIDFLWKRLTGGFRRRSIHLVAGGEPEGQSQTRGCSLHRWWCARSPVVACTSN